VLRAVEVLLQRQPSARIDADSFDLVPRAEVCSLIEAPRPIDPPVLQRLVALPGLQLLDQLLDLLDLPFGPKIIDAVVLR
jgi:hypothetical protein